MNYKIIILLIILLIIFYYYDKFIIIDKFNINNKFITDDKFYDYKLIFPQLSLINDDKDKILLEIQNLLNNAWLEWPEKYLYNINNDIKMDDCWKIIPLYGFGIWCLEYLTLLPTLHNFLKKINGLKIAIISKLKPHTKLEPHQGWSFHSNNVLRCHYGLILPKNLKKSFIGVSDIIDSNYSIKNHKLHDWIIFDDSKFHYAQNDSDEDRIVLIVDIERPSYIKKGNSSCNSTQELLEFVNKFTLENVKLYKKIPNEYLELYKNL